MFKMTDKRRQQQEGILGRDQARYPRVCSPRNAPFTSFTLGWLDPYVCDAYRIILLRQLRQERVYLIICARDWM